VGAVSKGGRQRGEGGRKKNMDFVSSRHSYNNQESTPRTAKKKKRLCDEKQKESARLISRGPTGTEETPQGKSKGGFSQLLVGLKYRRVANPGGGGGGQFKELCRLPHQNRRKLSGKGKRGGE